MTVKGGSSAACAACKYQRRKCPPDCVLAPYFPAHQHKTFQNVHRLYGVSKIMNLLKDMTTNDEREEAMRSIKYESEMRARFPVHGCFYVICQLHQELQQAVQESHYVHHQLSLYKDQFSGSQFTPNHNNCVDDEQVDLMMMKATPNNYSCEFDNSNNSSMLIQKPPVHAQENHATQGYEHVFFHPLGDDDNSQSYCESSLESSSRDLNDKCATKSEIKSAAADFSMISIK